MFRSQFKERTMPREPGRRKPTVPPRDGPVRPGSPLYRLLRMIAREVAKDHADDRPPARPGDDVTGETRPLDPPTREA